MLSPDYYEEMTEELELYWREIETEILEDIARRIKDTGGIMTETAKYQIMIMQEMGDFNNAITAKLAEAYDTTMEEANKIMENSVYEAIVADDRIVKEAFKKGQLDHYIPYSKDYYIEEINRGLTSINADIMNLTRTTAIVSYNKLYTSLNSAYLKNATNAFSQDKIVRDTINDLARDGLEWVDYASGTHRRIDTVVRTSVRSSVGYTVGKCQEQNLEMNDVNLVEVSAHMGARPSHEEWQGQIYWREKPVEGYDNFYEATGYGDVDGLCGVNCRHDFYPFFEGISEKANWNPEGVSDEESEELYELQQEQRYNERKIREWKRREKVKGAGGQDTTKEASKVAYWTDRNNQLIDSNERLKHDYDRERI